MAVEATHLNPFSPRLIQNRDLLNPPIQGNAGCAYSPQRFQFFGNSYGSALPENQPFYAPAVCGAVQAKTAVKIDGGRKRSRDELYATPTFTALQKHNTVSQFPSVSGGWILPQFQEHQFEIDDIISQHMKKIRLELEVRQRQQAKLLAAAIGEGVVKMLKEKDEEIQRMGKLNLVLQERVRTLYVENQMLREVARSNEATANSLRTNLEKVLLQVAGEEQHVSEEEEEVASCCGSIEEAERRCRKCGEREASVLMLPCRHLCLCNVCGSGSHQVEECPVCHSTMNATLHLNLSS